MESKKYEIVEDDFIIHKGRKLYRIRALKGLNLDTYTYRLTVKKGDIGGYVEGYHNLSQEGNCWISEDSKVYEDARVSDNALVGVQAEIYGNARAEDRAIVEDDAKVYGNAVIGYNARVDGCAKVYGNARVVFFAAVKENSKIYGNAKVTDSAIIWNSEICGNAKVKDCAKIFDNFLIHGNAIIGEFTELEEGAKEFSGNCAIFDSRYI